MGADATQEIMEKLKYIYNEVSNIVGQPLYLVGGSVRDIMLSKEPKDYDFCTPLLPEDIEAKIKVSGHHVYLTGKRFGTLGFRIMYGSQHVFVEITTFRVEQYEENNRKPIVEFTTNINQDLGRRDFTINAMAYSVHNNVHNVTDPFKGQTDLVYRIIRFVGKPKERIKEDPLRILRAIRFASQFNFTIEAQSLKAIIEKNYKILTISKERWMQELDKILLSSKPSIGLNLLAQTKILNFIFPELSLQVGYNQNSPFHQYTLWEHTLNVVDSTPPDLTLRWAALLHDIGKPFVRTEKENRSIYVKHDLLGAEIVDKIASYLRWSNDRRNAVRDLVEFHMNENSILREYDKRIR